MKQYLMTNAEVAALFIHTSTLTSEVNLEIYPSLSFAFILISW